MRKCRDHINLLGRPNHIELHFTFAFSESKMGDQHGGRSTPNPINRNLVIPNRAGGMAVCERSQGKVLRTKRRERSCASHMSVRALRRAKELSGCRISRHGFIAAGEQAMYALAEAERRPRALIRSDQDCGRAVRQRDLRAGTSQRAADLGAKSAQTFKSRRSISGQSGSE